MKNQMQLTVNQMNLPALKPLDSWIRQQILALGESRQIDAAHVRMARLENSSPAYQVRIHLVTPGPDVRAEGRDHTLRAACNKVLKQLREQISHRASKRLQKLKSNLKARRGC
jgi:ribosome-associated translation inhibitor RaiA